MRTAIATLVVSLFCGPILAQKAAEPSLWTDPELQRSLQDALADLALSSPIEDHRLALSLVDITDAERPRYAGVNDRQMMYAASLPKIAVLVAGFERIRAGLMEYTPAVKEDRKSTRLNSSHSRASRMPSSA